MTNSAIALRFNSITNTFYLRNPWGYRDSQLTWEPLISLQTVIQYSNPEN